jgi:hypothetical protein
MAFLALDTTDVHDGNAISLTTLDLIMIFFIDAIELVALVTCFVVEINLRCPVAVDAPAHA